MEKDKFVILRPLDSKPYYVRSVEILSETEHMVSYTPLLRHAKRHYTKEAAEAEAKLARGAAEVITLAEAEEREAARRGNG